MSPRILLTLLGACCNACTFSAPTRPLDAPILSCGSVRPAFRLTCKDARGERTVASDETLTLTMGEPADAALRLDCSPNPIPRPNQPFMGDALSAQLDAHCDLVEHVPLVSVTQTLTFETHTQRLCGTGQQGSSAIVPLKWTGTLQLPRVSTPRFDVRVTAHSEVLFPTAGQERDEGDLRQGCLLKVGGAKTDDFRLGERDVLRTTVPAATTTPVSFDCSVRADGTSASLNTLGCIGFQDAAFTSPAERRLRLTLAFRVSPSR